MPLLKPPDPKIPTRKYYVRIEEPLALTMERYAQFLGTQSVEHVVAQALEFVFRKDTDFKEWLASHPEPDGSKLNTSKKTKTQAIVSSSTPLTRAGKQEEASL